MTNIFAYTYLLDCMRRFYLSNFEVAKGDDENVFAKHNN